MSKSSLSSKIFCISWLPWSGWISQRKSLLAAEMKQARVCVSCLVMSNSATPWTVAHQTPLSLGFSRQEYWSGLHFLLQGIFPTQGSKLGLLHCRQILYQLHHCRGCSSTFIPISKCWLRLSPRCGAQGYFGASLKNIRALGQRHPFTQERAYT